MELALKLYLNFDISMWIIQILNQKLLRHFLQAVLLIC